MHGEGDVLVHAAVPPEDAGGVAVRAFVGTDAVHHLHAPLAAGIFLDIHQIHRPAVAFRVLPPPPAPQVVGTGDHAGLHGLGDPDAVHEIADFGGHPDQVARAYAHPVGVLPVHPHGIAVRDLVEPLGIAGPGVDQRGQPEGGQQREFPVLAVEFVGVHVALDVGGDGVFRPAPVHHGLGIEFLLQRRRGKARPRRTVHHDAHGLAIGDQGVRLRIDFGARDRLVVQRLEVFRVGRLLHLEGPVLAHVIQGGKSFLTGGLGQPVHVIEDVPVVFVDGDLLARPVGRNEVIPHAQAAVGIDAPGQFDPELVLFPDLARVGLVGEVHRVAHAPPRLAQDGLAEPDPGAGMGLVADDVVAFAGVAHGQHVVGEIGGLVPRGRQGRVQSDLLLVAQRLDPGKSVRVGPHRVEDAGEVHGQLPAPLFQEMGQEEAHLVMGERVFLREMQFVPELLVRGVVEDVGLELVPPARRGAALRADAAGEHVQEVEAARHGPAAGVAAARAAPVMGGETRSRPADLAGDLHDLRRRHAAFLLGELGGVFAVDRFERFDEPFEGARGVRVFLLQVGLPVDPRLHEPGVVQIVLQDDVGHGQQHRGLAARIGGQPVIGHAGRVGQPGVHDGEFGALHHALDDALRMGIEVVPRFQVGADQEDELRVGVVGRRPVEEVPEGVAEACAR